MRIVVTRLSTARPTVVLHPAEDDYVTRQCSVCSSDRDSILLTEVAGDGGVSLRCSLCTNCEHVYLSRLPTTEWYQRYYAETWDSGSVRSPGIPARARYALGTARLRVRRALGGSRLRSVFVRKVAGDVQAMQVFPMLLGVVEESGAYHADANVRKVLELGAGYGRVLGIFSRHGFEAVGTEASPQRAAACRERGLDVVDAAVDNLDAVAARGPFDLAYSLHVLEHIDDPLSHLRSVGELLRADGYLYLQVPYSMNEANVFHRAHSAVHCDSYSPRSLALLLRRAGFLVLRLQVDNNLQVVARKSESKPATYGPLPTFGATVDPDQLLDLLRVAAAEAPARIRVGWDHAYVEFRRAEDGSLIFDRGVHSNVDRLEPTPVTMEFEIETEEAKWPVRFEHRDRPPVLAKQS